MKLNESNCEIFGISEARISNGCCFVFRGTGGGYRYPFFHYTPQFLVMRPFFHNVPLKYCNAPVHYEKTGTLQKTDGRFTKKTEA